MQVFPSVKEYVIVCVPAPALLGVKMPAEVTPVPENVPPEGET